MVLCASLPGLKQTFRCQHRGLILTRSAYDHKRMRSAQAHGGGGQISGVLSPRSGGSGSYAKVWNSIRKVQRVEIRLRGLQIGSFKALAETIVHRLQKAAGLGDTALILL